MQILLHDRVKKKLKKLPISIQEKFFERMTLLTRNPYDIILNNHSVDRVYEGYMKGVEVLILPVITVLSLKNIPVVI